LSCGPGICSIQHGSGGLCRRRCPGQAAKKAKAGKKKTANKPTDAHSAKSAKDNDDFETADRDSDTPAKKAAKAVAKVVSAAKAVEKGRNAVVRFSLKGEYPEGAPDDGPFGEMQPTLGKLMDRLNEAKADKEVKAIWLRIEDLELGRGKVNEVRSAIAAIRKAGKPVYAELVSADTGAYLVASACDFIYMPASGDSGSAGRPAWK